MGVRRLCNHFLPRGSSALLLATVSACAVSADSNPDAVANTMVFATREICVPYVVDGAPLERLVQKPGIERRVDDVNGVRVVRYLINAPGHPMVTPTANNCWILANGTPEFADEVLDRFHRWLVLPAYRTSTPKEARQASDLVPSSPLGRAVTCVKGRRDALVSTNNPDFKQPPGFPAINGYIQINVDLSDATRGCG